jgi:hypothetical protein
MTPHQAPTPAPQPKFGAIVALSATTTPKFGGDGVAVGRVVSR